MPRARTTLFLFLLPALASVFVAAPGGATAFGATLGIGFTSFSPVSFLSFAGSGSGTSTGSGVAVPSGLFSGVVGREGGSWPFSRLTASIYGNGAGAFAGTAISGSMPVFGKLLVKGPFGAGPLTLIGVPLFQSHAVGSTAASIGLGVGGSDGFTLSPYSDAFLFWEHTLWTAGMKTLTGVMNGTAMYTGTDSRTPGGLGQVTLVSPTKVRTNLLGLGPQVFVLTGTLTFAFVPEPGTLLLLGAGVAALAARGRRAARRVR